MSTENKSGHVERPVDKPAEASDETKAIGRFAKYTAPAMLALLASGGFNKAFAQIS
jgi:hypothetical protein